MGPGLLWWGRWDSNPGLHMSLAVSVKILYLKKRIHTKLFTKTCKKFGDGLNDTVKLALGTKQLLVTQRLSHNFLDALP